MEHKEVEDFRKRKRAEDVGGRICLFQLTHNINPSPQPARHLQRQIPKQIE